MKVWNGQALKDEWLVTIKLDGVCAIVKDDVALSRANKPLLHLEHLADGIYEIFLGSWEETVSRIRTHEGPPIPKKYVYCLDPPDKRLHIKVLDNPEPLVIRSYLAKALKDGHEGLVLHGPEGKLLKVKPIETYDIPVLGVIKGKGKHLGKLGALMTEKGNVGTGFTDVEREELLYTRPGTVIEVEAMGLTPKGRFRHPRFKRVRFDK